MNRETSKILLFSFLAFFIVSIVFSLMNEGLIPKTRLYQGEGEVLCSVSFRTDKPADIRWDKTYKYLTEQGGTAYQKVRIALDQDSDGVLETYIYGGITSYQCSESDIVAYSHEGDPVCSRTGYADLFLKDLSYSTYRFIFRPYTYKPLPSTTEPLEPYKTTGQEVYEPESCVFELAIPPEAPEQPLEEPEEGGGDETPEEAPEQPGTEELEDWEDTEIPSNNPLTDLDSDNDGVPDDQDYCLNTPEGDLADSEGCGDTQKDTDGDGVLDSQDQCPNTGSGWEVDSNGCGTGQSDSDGDGVTDDIDLCPDKKGPYSNLGCPTGGGLIHNKTMLIILLIIISLGVIVSFLLFKKPEVANNR